MRVFVSRFAVELPPMPDNVIAERPDISAIMVRAFHRRTTPRRLRTDIHELIHYIELLEGERIVRQVLSGEP